MKYFLIAGEASGDLHAAHLMEALKAGDSEAEFCFLGGDRMSIVGGSRLRHYSTVAYMGFIPVLLHLRVILATMRRVKKYILHWQPDVVILVDYPGFNLSIAKFVRRHTRIPVYYYISPKIWAWKEHRIRQIRRDVDELFSILPFEVPFYEQKHGFPIHYVGNPSVDELAAFRERYAEGRDLFCNRHHLDRSRSLIALLPGSRKQEIKDNLRRMVLAASPLVERGYQLVVAAVSDIDENFYARCLKGLSSAHLHLVTDVTPRLLSHAEAALVTSGTATLETALLRVPQVVCYYAPLGPLVRFLKRKLLHVPYISLVNLIVGRQVVPELVADEMNVARLRHELEQILEGGAAREAQLEGYDLMAQLLGPAGAPQRAASEMLRLLRREEGPLAAEG